MEYNLLKGVAMRFLRGALSGALSTMVVVVGTVSYSVGVTTFLDVKNLLVALTVAGMIGAISGGILGFDKYYRSVE